MRTFIFSSKQQTSEHAVMVFAGAWTQTRAALAQTPHRKKEDTGMATRILLVDDEPGIRETLHKILAMHGFDVTSASTVAEALSQIARRPYDVLVADLNIGQPGDGFTVVSAMKRTHPDCRTFILTGYPAFESALQAIRSQVDDYLVKPASIPELIGVIEQNLRAPGTSHRPMASKRVYEIIREKIPAVVERMLAAMKAQPELASLGHSDQDHISPFAPLLQELAWMLENPESSAGMMQAAAWRGYVQRLQGYSIPLVITSFRLLEDLLYDLVNENLLLLEISEVIPDIRRLNSALAVQLEASIKAYLETHERRLVFDRSEKWAGWLCLRCCWNRPVPKDSAEYATLTESIQAEFDAHDCEAFARQNWRRMGT
jgi:ActR/RegA family two-component response regulator